ncbi:long-chain-fatty-acid--CoA ligase ACSBG2-like [Oscarella lobularis]|uniref:long-chain-fatty-acid--CoA ligase ACSBG2-like n=1 Tax=Oscarella lobularis TaxID=121494 RepID=UPI0033139B0F
MSDETKQSDDNAASEPSPSAQEAEPQWKDLDKGPIWVLEPSQPFRIAMGDKPPSSLPPRTVDQLFRSAVKRGPESMALAVKRDGGWKRWTWQQYYNDTKRVAKAFIKLGLEPFHGVGILGFNSPEWFMSLVGGILAGGLGTGIYTTNSPDACRHILEDSKANIVVVENDKQMQKILPMKSELSHLKAIVQYTGELSEKPDDSVLTWNELLEWGKDVSDDELQKRLDAQKPNNCCSLVYTSGTTGLPKGVMLSHDSITWTPIAGISTVRKDEQAERCVSYLPLSHVAAQMMDVYLPMHVIAETWFAQPDALKGSLGTTLKEVRPTYFLGVPRVWEKIAERYAIVSSSFGAFKSRLVGWARRKALEGNLSKEKGESTPFGYWIANSVLLKRVREEFGLDCCNYCFTGAAPISAETTEFFLSVGLPLLDIYGMSESSGPGTMSGVDMKKFGSCGRPFYGCEMKLHNPDDEGNGELCFRGRHVFMGYLGLEDKTKEALDDEGWLHTGDIGTKDEDGYYFITGRVKELIVTSGGENIPPVLIESAIKAELPIISNVMVVGDKKKFLSCILTLKVNVDFDTGEPTDNLSAIALKECESVGSTSKRVSEVIGGGDPKILEMIEKGIKRANDKAISNAQKVQKWSLLAKDFSIPGGELGPTLKLKRKVVSEKYQETIDRMYEI